MFEQVSIEELADSVFRVSDESIRANEEEEIRQSTMSFSQSAKDSNIADSTGSDLADEGIQAAMDNANEKWKADVLEILRYLSITHREFNADDLARIMKTDGVPNTHPNAIGGLFREANKRNWCKKTDKYVKSKVPKKHSRILLIWESLLHD